MKKKANHLLIFLVCFFLTTICLNSNSDRLNVLVITIDTLRADWLSCYNSKNLKTPNTDSLAERGVLFSRAFANTSTTLPSHTNFFLGTTPLHHGVHENSNFIVREEFLTLAEHLKAHGYSTGAFVGAFPLDAKFGLNQGFDIYDDNFPRRKYSQKFSGVERKAEIVVDNALDWLKSQESLWFLWIHCWDPHDPYEPPEPFKTQYEKHPYSGEVAYTDFVLAKLFEYLEEENLFDNTLIIFTGDHGESLGEHGEKTHGFYAYNSTIWIPLIIVSPGIRQAQSEQYVSHLDVFPTVCDILNIEKPTILQGTSLFPILKGKKIPKKPIYFESMHPYYSIGWGSLRGYIYNKKKFIDSPIPEFYCLKKDFDELNNLAEKKRLDKYRKKLGTIIKEQSLAESTKAEKKLDKESLDKLRSLGYVSNSYGLRKESVSPDNDIKVLLPFFYKSVEALELFEEGKIEQGLEQLKEVITERKDVSIAYNDLAVLYKRIGMSKEALEVLKLGLKNIPSSYLIFKTYINHLLDDKQHDEVIKAIGERNFREMNFDPEIWNFLAISYCEKGDFEKAIEIFEKALLLDKKSPVLFTNIGEAQLLLSLKINDLRIFQKCLESFQKAIEFDSNYALAYSGLGQTYRQAGDLEGAVYAFEKALELEPNLDKALFFLGLSYFDKGDKEKAINSLNLFKEKFYHLQSDSNKQNLDVLIQRCKE